PVVRRQEGERGRQRAAQGDLGGGGVRGDESDGEGKDGELPEGGPARSATAACARRHLGMDSSPSSPPARSRATRGSCSRGGRSAAGRRGRRARGGRRSGCRGPRSAS